MLHKLTIIRNIKLISLGIAERYSQVQAVKSMLLVMSDINHGNIRHYLRQVISIRKRQNRIYAAYSKINIKFIAINSLDILKDYEKYAMNYKGEILNKINFIRY